MDEIQDIKMSSTTSSSINKNPSSSSGGGGGGGSATAAAATKKKKKMSVLDMIILAIRSSPPSLSSSSSGGDNGIGSVSRVTIVKYLKTELNYDNSSQIKLAFKRGITKNILTQIGQSFVVTKDPPRKPSNDDEKDKEPLVITTISEGCGGSSGGSSGISSVAEHGDVVTVQYVGKLKDGTIFDTAKKFDFILGIGDVIKGWDKGIVGMKVGMKRKLIVPSHLGYGKRGCSPDIPPNSTLFFDITMKNIVKQQI